MMAYQIIWIISILTVAKGQTLPEGKAEQTTVCAGTILRGSCPANERIAGKDVQYGTKLTDTCGLSNTSAECCYYDDGDCFQPSYTDTAQQAACTGRTLCNDVTVGQADTSSCPTGYPGLNHYLTMQYYCVPESRIFSMCTSIANSSTGSLLYLQNQDYPSAIRATETSCTCSVETPSCSSHVNVYFIQFHLADGSNSCNGTQQIVIADKETLITLSCANNTDFAITRKLTSTSNYLIITLDNIAGTNDGYLWIGFDATDSTVPLKLNCPHVGQTICMDCPDVVNITNGTASTAGGLSTGQNAIYSCDLGFDLLGNDTRTCLDNGTWSGVEPTCQIKECPGLSSPASGNVTTAGGVTVGQTATYECNYGYEIQGEKSRICQVNATWSGDEPSCIEIVCPSLPDLANGTVRTDGFSIGQTASYSCNAGYQLTGNVRRTCQQDGTWNGSSPECAERTCPVLTSPENGSVSTNGVTIGNRANYSCSVGYILTGNDSRTCQNDFTWSGTPPLCTARELGDTCTAEAECAVVIPESTCNNSICVCAEGENANDKGCKRPGPGPGPGPTTEPGDDLPVWAIVLIVLGALAVVIILMICWYKCNKCRQDDRVRGQSIDYPDKYKQENTDNKEKDSHAYNNNAYIDILMEPVEDSQEVNLIESVEDSQEVNLVNETHTATGETRNVYANSIEKEHQDDNGIKSTKDEDTSGENKSEYENKHPEYDNRELLDDKDPELPKSGEKKLIDNAENETPKDKNNESPEVINTQIPNSEDNGVINDDDGHEPHKEETTEHIKDEIKDKAIEEPPAFCAITNNSEESRIDTIEAMEVDIKESGLSLNLDEQFSETAQLIKDVTNALFRSASMAKRDLIDQAKAGLSGFKFDTAEDSEWSRGLISAAKDVLAAIYSMCSIANELAHGENREDGMEASVREVRRAINHLVTAYRVEAGTESVAMQNLQKACKAVNQASETLVSSAQQTRTKAALEDDGDQQTQSRKTKTQNITLDDSDVLKAKQRIEVQETVIRKQKELQKAQTAVQLLNQEQNKFQKQEDSSVMLTQL